MKILGISAFLTSFVFFLSLFAVHILQADFNFLARTYSDYVLGPYGYIVTTSLISVGISQLLLAASYFRLFKSKWLVVLFTLAGLGGVLTGIFPTTAAKDMNFLRTLHIVGSAIQFGTLPWGFIVLSRVLPKSVSKSYFLANGIATFALFTLFGSLFLLGIDKEIGYFGLLEKADIFLLISGLLTASMLVIVGGKRDSLNSEM